MKELSRLTEAGDQVNCDGDNSFYDLHFDEKGLIPAIVQDADSGKVLMLGYMNVESLRMTLRHRETYFWSRSRQSLWHKGESSGHVQKVMALWADCDRDSLLVLVRPAGPACHTGEFTCFHNAIDVSNLEEE